MEHPATSARLQVHQQARRKYMAKSGRPQHTVCHARKPELAGHDPVPRPAPGSAATGLGKAAPHLPPPAAGDSDLQRQRQQSTACSSKVHPWPQQCKWR